MYACKLRDQYTCNMQTWHHEQIVWLLDFWILLCLRHFDYFIKSLSGWECFLFALWITLWMLLQVFPPVLIDIIWYLEILAYLNPQIALQDKVIMSITEDDDFSPFKVSNSQKRKYSMLHCVHSLLVFLMPTCKVWGWEDSQSQRRDESARSARRGERRDREVEIARAERRERVGNRV